MKFNEFLKAYGRVCRMEYIRLEGPGVFFPLFLAATSIDDLIDIHIIEAIAIFALLFFSGFMINSLADVDVDSKYKTFISDSVVKLGEKTIKRLIVLHVVIAFLLALHLSFIFNNYWLIVWAIIATFFGLSYSVKPFHFKVRGILQFTLMIFTFPLIVILYYVVAGTPPIPVLLIFLFFLIAHHGLDLVNQAQDFLEDKECNLSTPAVRWGITKTLIAAFILTSMGLCLAFIGFYLLYNNLSPLVVMGYPLSHEILFAITVLLLIISYHTPLKGTWHLIKISLTNESIEKKIMMIKNRLNYTRWQFAPVLGATFISTLYFIWKIMQNTS